MAGPQLTHRQHDYVHAAHRFFRELAAIERLYRGSLFAYDLAWASVATQIAGGRLAPDARFERQPGHSAGHTDPVHTGVIASSPDVLERRLRGEFPEHLREVLIVRAVSAFETLLLDAVRDLFTLRPDLFHKGEDLQISVGQALSMTHTSALATLVINRDLRGLSSGGLRKMQTYYRQRFGIDLAAAPGGWQRVTEVVDRRHLLVHRLGRTDAKYRRDYGVQALQLTVGRAYFAAALDALRRTGRWIETEVERCVGRVRLGAATTPSRARAQVTVRPRTRRGRAAVQPGFTFTADDDMIRLGDIVDARELAESGVALRLSGTTAQLDGYCAALRDLRNEQHIGPFEYQYTRTPRRGRSGFPRGLLEAVAESLPAGNPPPEGSKRELAEQLGVTPGVIAAAIRYLRFVPTTAQLDAGERWMNGRKLDARSHLELAREIELSTLGALRVLDAVRDRLRARRAAPGSQSESVSRVSPRDAEPNPYAAE